MSSHMAGLVTEAAPNADYILVTALAVAAAAGVVTGALYRVGAAIFASLGTIIAVGFIGAGADWSFWRTTLVAFGLIAALQVGYAVGVAMTVSGGRVRNGVARGWRRVAALNGNTQRKSAGKPPE